MEIRLAFSCDADDAFMFQPLLSGLTPSDGLEIEPVHRDIQALNDAASRGEFEATVLSAHAYAYARDRYRLAPCCANFGDGYGPVIAANTPLRPEDLGRAGVAIPGATTSAYMVLQLYRPDLRTRVLPWDKIVASMRAGIVDCGLLLHRGDRSVEQAGLHAVVDLGAWWARKTNGLPLPLGVCAIRRDVPETQAGRLAGALAASVRYALDHAEQTTAAVNEALGEEEGPARRQIELYVTELSANLTERGRRALEEFYRRGAEEGIIPNVLPLEFIEAR